MHKNQLTHLTFLFIFITLHFQIIAQDVPRWEDFKPILNSNNVFDVVVNSQKEVWLTSRGDFLFLDQDKKHIVDLGIDINFDVEHMEIDANDTIWLASSNSRKIDNKIVAFAGYKEGGYKYYYRDEIPGFPDDNSNNDLDISDLYIDPSGIKWFGFVNGDVGKFDLQNQYTHYVNDKAGNDEVRDMALDPTTGALYVAINAHLYKLSGGAWDFSTFNWAYNTYVDAVAVANDGTVLFGGHQGLHSLKDGIITTQDTINSNIPVDRISDIKIAGEKIYFTGPDAKGYDIVFDEGFNLKHKGKFSSIFNFATLTIESGSPMILWLGSDEDGLVQINEPETNYYNNQTVSLPIRANDMVNRTVFVGDLGYVATGGGLTIKRDSLFEGLHPYYTNPSIDLPGDGTSNDIAYDSANFVYIATTS
ncbi:MAG: hypothetical protein KAI29_14830, partial [Cyclobacteriaceae bacterium]|nr:hypothetical protein [Cyclobacteriaceae bacterium]